MQGLPSRFDAPLRPTDQVEVIAAVRAKIFFARRPIRCRRRSDQAELTGPLHRLNGAAAPDRRASRMVFSHAPGGT
jgi:hypothetical protein